MENKLKISEEIRKKLRDPFPSEAIKPHPTKKFLSTIKAIYIVERLNNIFGVANWTTEHEIVSDTPDYVAVKGRIVVFEPFNIATPYQYGGHNKTGVNTEPADGYKSAVTDCQSKCASYLEIGIDVFKGLVTARVPIVVKSSQAARYPEKTVPEEDEETIRMREDCKTKLITMANGDIDKASNTLEEMTQFKGRDGIMVKGLQSCNQLKGARLTILYSKLFPKLKV